MYPQHSVVRFGEVCLSPIKDIIEVFLPITVYARDGIGREQPLPADTYL